MASSSRRVSRKELRQPDWFQTATENAFDLYAAHRVKTLLALVVLTALLLGVWGWNAFKSRQDAVASQEFGRALILYHGGKHREAIAALAKVQTHRWSKYGHVAYLYQANSHLALNDLPKAAEAAQQFIVGTDKNPLMRQMGLLTLATIEERQSRCKEAIKHYADAEKIKGPFTERAFLGKARCAAQQGDLSTALAAYRQLLKEQPESPSATYIALEISELEAKLSGQKPEK
jgi:predicted negative regulator of RcsB-dependent stress response